MPVLNKGRSTFGGVEFPMTPGLQSEKEAWTSQMRLCTCHDDNPDSHVHHTWEYGIKRFTVKTVFWDLYW